MPLESDFNAIFRKQHLGAVRYAQSQYGLEPDAADQIVSNAFLSLYEVMSLGERIQHINTWLRKNIRARYIDWLRQERHIRRLRPLNRAGLDVNTLGITHTDFETIDIAEAVQLAIQHLDQNEQDVVNFVLIAGHNVLEAANKFGITSRTMERRISTVKRRLRVTLKTLIS